MDVDLIVRFHDGDSLGGTDQFHALFVRERDGAANGSKRLASRCLSALISRTVAARNSSMDEVVIREIRASDARLLHDFYERLSFDSRRQRFLGSVGVLSEA